jgi:hypothetical protein
MKIKMEEIDELIKEPLSKEEAVFYDSLEEQNLIEMVGGLFNTKNRWLIILMNIVQVISFIFFIYCLVQFLNTEETNELIKWGVGGFVFLFMSSYLKLFSWMQMDKNALLREMKRLELQLSSIAGKKE